MKRIMILCGLTLLLASCSMKTYYQVYQTKPVDETGFTTTTQAVTYAAGDVEVRYDFFDENGDAGFWIQNNTDELLYLDLGESFFVLNGVANDYYQGRSWEKTISQTTTLTFKRHEGEKSRREMRKMEREIRRQVSLQDGSTSSEETSASESKAQSHQERAVVIVPPHSAKRVSEFKIAHQMLSLCGVKETPMGSKTSGQAFTAENTPITFTNYLTYTLGKKGASQHISNTFYVSEIINAGEKAMKYEVRMKDACGKEMSGKENTVEAFNHNTPDRFYVTYRR